MSEPGFALFDTPIGRCAIAWRGAAVAGILLPERDSDRLRQRVERRFPNAQEREPPPSVRQAIHGILRLLGGEPENLLDVEVDLGRAGEFERAVYAFVRAIPPGEVRTYGEVAAALGAAGAARAVGRAMGSNPVPIIVPCHRVVGANGASGGFSAPGGAEAKIGILNIERARRAEEGALFDRLPLMVKPI